MKKRTIKVKHLGDFYYFYHVTTITVGDRGCYYIQESKNGETKTHYFPVIGTVIVDTTSPSIPE